MGMGGWAPMRMAERPDADSEAEPIGTGERPDAPVTP